MELKYRKNQKGGLFGTGLPQHNQKWSENSVNSEMIRKSREQLC